MQIKRYCGNQRVRSVYNWNRSFKLDKRFQVIKIRHKGELIGNVAVEKDFIYFLIVNPKFRNRGFGKLLISEAEKIIFKKYNQVNIVPRDNDEELRKYYSFLGYIGHSKNEVGYDEADKFFWTMTKRRKNDNR